MKHIQLAFLFLLALVGTSSGSEPYDQPCRAPIPYDATTWNGSTCYAPADAIRDKIEAIISGAVVVDDTPSDGNTTEAASSNSVYDRQFGTINLHTDAAVVLTAAQCRIQDININGSDTAKDFTLPAAAAGLMCCLDAHIYTRVITVDPVDGTDTIILNGVALTAGNAIDSGGVAGEQFCLIGLDATYWRVINGTATISDGGAD